MFCSCAANTKLKFLPLNLIQMKYCLPLSLPILLFLLSFWPFGIDKNEPEMPTVFDPLIFPQSHQISLKMEG